MTKIKAWISAARLRTLPLSISGIVTAGAAAKVSGNFNWSIFFLALATTLGFQILSNFANDYGDGIKGTDNQERVGPKRAMQSGILTAKDLKYGMVITTIITLLLASLLIFIAFGMEHFILSVIFFNLGIAAIIAAITYTVGKSAYGYRSLGDVFVFLFFGLVGVMGSYFLFTQDLNNYILFPAIAIGLMSTAVLNLNNMRDRITDARANKITLAVLLGERRIKIYHAALIIFALICAIIYFSVLPGTIIRFLPLIAFLPLLWNVRKVIKNKSASLLDPELKKVALSTFLFSIIFFALQFV